MTLHLSSLDEAEHSYGAFSTQANQDLEAIDTMLSELAAGGSRRRPGEHYRRRLRSWIHSADTQD